MPEKVTVPRVRAMKKRGEKVVCVTAYDAIFGGICDRSGVDVILVGDSVGNTVMGLPNTLGVSLEAMVHHTRAVRTSVQRSLLVSDLPFGSYQASPEQALRSSVELIKAGADAVKLEGEFVEAIRLIVRAGIPVMGHVGMTPQSVHQFGGFRVQGKGSEGDLVRQQSVDIDQAGAFAIVLELIPADLAKIITESTTCPTIGIGAGPDCDGQIQVLFDLLGLAETTFKHAKEFVDGKSLMESGLTEYVNSVRNSSFPTEMNSF